MSDIKILDSYQKAHEGNDCMIVDSVVLIQLSDNRAIIVENQYVYASWISDSVRNKTVTHDYGNMKLALKDYENITSTLKDIS
jgi:hypothetical protein